MVIKQEKLTCNVFLRTTRLNVKKWTILNENFSTLYSTYFYSQFLIFSALPGFEPQTAAVRVYKADDIPMCAVLLFER